MNSWPSQQNIDEALAQGILLNVCRAAPYPGESDKRRIARGMSIAGFETIRQTHSLVDWLDDQLLAIFSDVARGNDWHRIIADGMSRR